MLFDGPPSELPIATLRPSMLGRRRRIVVDLTHRWARCAAWLRPRTVPLLVAFASLFAMLGAVKGIPVWTDPDSLALSMSAREYPFEVVEAPPPRRQDRGFVCGFAQTRVAIPEKRGVTIWLRPIAPGGPYVELRIAGPRAR